MNLGNEFMVVDNGLGEAVPFINELPATGASEPTQKNDPVEMPAACKCCHKGTPL